MKTASLAEAPNYNEKRPAISILMETESTKEIRIVFKKGQVMKEHQTPFPIVIQIFSGAISFGVTGEKHILEVGDLISLNGAVPHDLKALADSIVRLSLSKKDTISRVKKIKSN